MWLAYGCIGRSSASPVAIFELFGLVQVLSADTRLHVYDLQSGIFEPPFHVWPAPMEMFAGRGAATCEVLQSTCIVMQVLLASRHLASINLSQCTSLHSTGGVAAGSQRCALISLVLNGCTKVSNSFVKAADSLWWTAGPRDTDTT